jgi:hypothetical protein
MKKNKTYTELMTLPTFEERYEYLRLNGTVGTMTFGPDRFINQRLYHSADWLEFRQEIILRDMGCDLGCPDRIIDGVIWVNGKPIKIHNPVTIHHINPVDDEDILYMRHCVLDPDNVICCSAATHKAIHYGSYSLLADSTPIVRTPNDTIPWR